MFCPECGYKNEEKALFCENCGTKLEEAEKPVSVETVSQEAPEADTEEAAGEEVWEEEAKKKRTLAVSTKILLAEAVLCAVALFACIFVYDMTYSGESVAERYVKAQLRGDWNTVYDLMDVSGTDGELMTKEAFVTARELAGEDESKGAKIRDVKKTSGGAKTQSVRVRYRKDGKSDTAKVKLERFGLQWKVTSSDYIVGKIAVKVQKGADVTVDKVQISGKEDPEQLKDSDVYTIGPVFGKKHYVEVTKKGMEDVKRVQEFEETSEKEDKARMPVIQSRYDEDTLKKVTDQAVTDFKDILAKAWEGKRAGEIKAINEMYDKNKDEVTESYGFYQTLQVANEKYVEYTNIEATANTITSDDHVLVEVKLSADYHKKYSYFESNGTSNSILRYIEDDGTWKLYNVSL